VIRSESKLYKGIGRHEVRTGRVVRQVGSVSGQPRAKTRWVRKKLTGTKELGKILVDLAKQDDLAQRHRKHRDK
jgi:hypothetical protein